MSQQQNPPWDPTGVGSMSSAIQPITSTITPMAPSYSPEGSTLMSNGEAEDEGPSEGQKALAGALKDAGNAVNAGTHGQHQQAFNMVFGHPDLNVTAPQNRPGAQTSITVSSPTAIGQVPQMAPPPVMSDRRAKTSIRDGRAPVRSFLDDVYLELVRRGF